MVMKTMRKMGEKQFDNFGSEPRQVSLRGMFWCDFLGGVHSKEQFLQKNYDEKNKFILKVVFYVQKKQKLFNWNKIKGCKMYLEESLSS